MTDFVHLHTHSHYSLLDGLAKIPELVSLAKELKMDTLALTDHGAMYGAIEFYKECLSQEIKPILGVETYIAPRRMEDKTPKIDSKPYHLILLAKNKNGYKNLLEIVTQAHLVGHYYRPRIDKIFLKNHSEGLIALTSCVFGEIPQIVLSGDMLRAKKTIKEYQEIIGRDNFYLELQDHPGLPEQAKINKGLINLSKETGAPLVATSDVHYLKKEDAQAHEVLLRVQTGKDAEDESKLSQNEVDLSLRSPEEMALSFKDLPQAIENSRKIADQCNLKIEFGKPILPKFPLGEKETSRTYLEKLVKIGLKERFGKITPEIQKRADYELKVIEKTHFEDYILIVADYVNFAKTHGIMVGPGRGSAAGSLVSYVLKITDVDPLKYGLLFERFLNPERIAPPDIDLDFADKRRAEVIKYISGKYGSERVAQIITFGTMASRGSIRDTGRALGMSYSDVDKIAKLIPFGLTLKQSLEAVSELKDLYKKDPEVKRLLDMAQKLEGVVRHASTHAAGLVIAKEPLVNYVPLQFSPRGLEEIITQYAMGPIEDIGLIKMDILGLSNLTILEDAIRIIKATRGVEIDLENLPLDDLKTYQLLARAETTGVFQLESDGMKRNLKELKPTEFANIIAMVALYRPGPMEFIPDYIAGKLGRKKVTYLHPKLEPILKNTYGIAVYQEQVLQIARDIAGFSLGEADILRKAVGKKIKKLLMEQQHKFINGALKNGISEKVAQKLFQFIEPFAEYGFNLAHATCYGLIAYQTAYLKTHFPSEFMAALLTSDQNNLDKLAIAISEAERMKIKVLPPDVNESFVEFGVVKDSGNIRFGLSAIKNVGEGVARETVKERKDNGPYQSLEDFVRRLGGKTLNKKVIESLAKAGALDRFAERNQILAGIEIILKFISNLGKVEKKDQLNLFSEKSKAKLAALELPEIEPAPKKQRLSWEKELLGMFVSEHPLQGMEEILKSNGSPLGELKETMTGQKITVAGLITNIQKILTKNKEPMLFVTLEDTSSRMEILVFPKIFAKNNLIWQANNIIKVYGRLNNKDGTLKIIADRAEEIAVQQSLDSPKEDRLIIKLPKTCPKETLSQIKEILLEFPGDCPVYLYISKNGNEEQIKTRTKISPNHEIISKLEEILGEKLIKIQKA